MMTKKEFEASPQDKKADKKEMKKMNEKRKK